MIVISDMPGFNSSKDPAEGEVNGVWFGDTEEFNSPFDFFANNFKRRIIDRKTIDRLKNSKHQKASHGVVTGLARVSEEDPWEYFQIHMFKEGRGFSCVVYYQGIETCYEVLQ